jgi:hypothetical protein
MNTTEIINQPGSEFSAEELAQIAEKQKIVAGQKPLLMTKKDMAIEKINQ